MLRVRVALSPRPRSRDDGGVVDSDQKAEEPKRREEILARHEPIHTYGPRRPRRKQVTGVWEVILIAWALVCGVLAGLFGPLFWGGIVWALLGWLLPHGRTTFYVIFLIPPVALIGWAMLRERERDLQPATKAFLGAMFFTWLFFVFTEPWIVS